MMIKKLIAVLSAVTIMGTGAAYSGSLEGLKNSFAAETSAEQNETCKVMISVKTVNEKLPGELKAKLIAVKGEEKTELAEWSPADTDVKEIGDLEYSDDVSYRIVFEGAPEGFRLPDETNVKLAKKGSVDKIVIIGFSNTRFPGFTFPITNGDELHFNRRYLYSTETSKAIYNATLGKEIDEAYITDDKGFRYVNDRSDTNSAFVVPDGHYKAYVKPAEGYRFVKKYSGSALVFNDMENIPIAHFEKDLSEGIEFNVKYGKADQALDFCIEKIPSDEKSCSANVSVVDADTGELLEGCIVELDENFTKSNGHLRWSTSDQNPVKVDALYEIDRDYCFKVKNTPLCYEPCVENEFRFEKQGEQKEIVLKVKRTMTDKEAAALKTVELPKEDPVTVDSEHCAVTVGYYDLKTRTAVKNQKVSIVEYVGGKKADSKELISWKSDEEPVKTVTDIEFHEDSEYYITFNDDNIFKSQYNNSGRIKLYFSKGGDTEKIAVPGYVSGVAYVNAECYQCTYTSSMKEIRNINPFNSNDDILKSAGVYDDNGYRYSFSSALSPYALGGGALPDGDYTLKCVPGDDYRFISTGSQTAVMDMLMKRTTEDNIIRNEENGKNGMRFTVKDGIVEQDITLFLESVPTAETSCSADISIVDAQTNEPVKGIHAQLIGGSINTNNILNWDTDDTPVKTFDNLLYTKKDYGVKLFNVPECYKNAPTCIAASFSFDEYGEHKDIVIKLEKAYSLGDVDNDGQVNSVDASSVLSYYSKVSTKQDGGYTDSQKLAADVDKDGSINSVDASKILSYYAYVSTAKEDIKTPEEYINTL